MAHPPDSGGMVGLSDIPVIVDRFPAEAVEGSASITLELARGTP
jgi:hypothetical protein